MWPLMHNKHVDFQCLLWDMLQFPAWFLTLKCDTFHFPWNLFSNETWISFLGQNRGGVFWSWWRNWANSGFKSVVQKVSSEEPELKPETSLSSKINKNTTARVKIKVTSSLLIQLTRYVLWNVTSIPRSLYTHSCLVAIPFVGMATVGGLWWAGKSHVSHPVICQIRPKEIWKVTGLLMSRKPVLFLHLYPPANRFILLTGPQPTPHDFHERTYLWSSWWKPYLTCLCCSQVVYCQNV